MKKYKNVSIIKLGILLLITYFLIDLLLHVRITLIYQVPFVSIILLFLLIMLFLDFVRRKIHK